MDWQVIEIEKVSWLTEEDAKKDSEVHKSFLMAKESGRSLVFHVWSGKPKKKH